jgi:hypothetical protein
VFALPWRRIGAAVAAVLFAVAALLAVLDVRVAGRDGAARSCGSALDVVSGRADWQSWRAQDLLDLTAADSPSVVLTRAAACSAAVNDRTAWAGGLIGGACLLTALVWPWRAGRSARFRRRDSTARLAVVVAVVGGVLTVAGLVGIGLLLANPDATLFVYVSRPVVGLIGLLLLTPAVALWLGGWALRVTARDANVDAGGDDS